MNSNLLDKKIEYWKNKLLDFTRKNKMINYRESKRSTLEFIDPSFDELFDKIAIKEQTLTFKNSIDKETDIRVFSMLSLLDNLSTPLLVEVGDIKTKGSISERQATLKNMRTKARLAQEEQGVNILYLSFGFIEWKYNKTSSLKEVKSPLILVPVVLKLESLNSPYKIEKHEDDVVINPTIQYYFKTEYGIDLPDFDIDKDNIKDYLKNIEKIADKRGWRIVKEVNLGLLSFQKITMYHDICLNEERIKENFIIKAISGDGEDVYKVLRKLPNMTLDSINPQDCYQVMSADSSQQEAILYSKNNISFVMQGPPGTGKSQTITNIIAEALADGKKVLFVSEKMAALQVVYKRLQDVNLGEFCLPLHSNKADKKEIIEQIGANLQLMPTTVKGSDIHDLEELFLVRNKLNNYVQELHRLNPELDISCYDVYFKLNQLKNIPYIIFNFEDITKVTQLKLQSYLNNLKEYSIALHQLNYVVKGNQWSGLVNGLMGQEYSQKMCFTLNNLRGCLDKIERSINEINDCKDLVNIIGYDLILSLTDILKEIIDIDVIPDIWLSDIDMNELIIISKKAQELYNSLFDLSNRINNVFKSNISEYDYNAWNDQVLSISKSLSDMNLIRENSYMYYIDNNLKLSENFISIKKEFVKIKNALTRTNDILGTNFVGNTYHQKVFNDLYELIKENIILLKIWYNSDISYIKNACNESKDISSQLKSVKEEILKEWEPEVLDIDYSSILMRYKTDYTSIFKIFNIQYYKDKKLIKALSKDIVKKLPDEVVFNLLNKIKIYNEKLDWFDKNNTNLSNYFGIYYIGFDSNWEYILKAIDIVEKIKSLPINCVSNVLIDVLSSDHSSQIEILKSSLIDIKSGISNVKEIIKNDNFNNIDIDLEDFDSNDCLLEVELYISEINRLNLQLDSIKPYLNNNEEKMDVVLCTIKDLNTYNDITQKTLLFDNIYKNNFDFLYKRENTDWCNIINLIEKVSSIKKHHLYKNLSNVINSPQIVKQQFKNILLDIVSEFNSMEDSFQWFISQFSSDMEFNKIPISQLNKNIHTYIENMNIMSNWIDYKHSKSICENNGLGDFINKIEEKELFQNIGKIFLKSFYTMWLEKIYNDSNSLNYFRKNIHQQNIDQFVKLDELQLTISQKRIRKKLIENMSSKKLMKMDNELSILNKELNKKRRVMPLRKLFSSIPNLLINLKPCFMMSPLSVAYFLDSEKYSFDLVIFDEASQIFPEDAIGAIFRGSQVIIAGDSKQMPPSNFFSTSFDNLDNEYDSDEDIEFSDIVSDSILEETALVLPTSTLLWHYRSKHESLIAFSNSQIYKNNLIIFPSNNNLSDMGVEYVYVSDGYYEGRGKNCNVREAEKCVELVIEHIKKYPDRSLGIIAFSEKQQTAIENKIIEFRQSKPEYESFFDESKEEPFFVKNLENVQGDERDTIIFSICYAKDLSGKMYMRFGPLGHEGGERRLNVAITRAKCNVKLVGSILPSDIDINRTKSKGIHMLRDYIEYAQKGSDMLKSFFDGKKANDVDKFCDIISEFLEQNGYKIKKNIGCSEYKIDIAVENPNVSGEFIAGIECDGLSYVKAKTARDRDHLRKSVLKSMGWNLYRVWSTEWYRNPEVEARELLSFLKSIVDNTTYNGAKKDKVIKQEVSANFYDVEYYKKTKAEDFYKQNPNRSLSKIGNKILFFVSNEQPIHINLLCQSINFTMFEGKVYEFNQFNINDKIAVRESIAGELKDMIFIDECEFVRLKRLSKIAPRIPRNNGFIRPIEYVHKEEISKLILKIIEKRNSVVINELIVEVCNLFKFDSNSDEIINKIKTLIKELIRTERVVFKYKELKLIGE